ncbi:MAG: MBL fold metallo-hydrolase, partial [Terriglobia bacterium]
MSVNTIVVGDLGTNCYVLSSGSKAAVIDPGGDGDAIQGFLSSRGFDLELILLTHGHFDHVGALKFLEAETEAEVYVSSREGFDAGNAHDLADGDVIEFGDLSLRVIETPGHTPGGVSISVDDLLFVGDLLFRGSIGRTDLPGGSWEEIARSLKKVREFPDSTKVYPGHGPETTVGAE